MATDSTADLAGRPPAQAPSEMSNNSISDMRDAGQPQRHDAMPVTGDAQRQAYDLGQAQVAGQQELQGLPSDKEINVDIRCPSLERLPSSLTQVRIRSGMSIAIFKECIRALWPGEPPNEALRFFKAGHLLADDVIIGELLDKDGNNDTVILHLVVRAGSWMTALAKAMQAGASEGSALPVQTTEDTHTGSTRSQTPERPSVRFALPPVHSLSRNASSAADHALSSTQARGLSTHARLEHVCSPTAFATAVEGVPHSRQHTRESKALAHFLRQTGCKDYDSIRQLLVLTQTHYMTTYEEIWMRAYGDTIAGAKERSALYECDTTPEQTERAVVAVENPILQWGPVEVEVNKKLSSSKSEGTNRRWEKIDIEGLPFLLQEQVNACTTWLKVLKHRIMQLEDLCWQLDLMKTSMRLVEGPTASPGTQPFQSTRQEVVAVMAQHPVYRDWILAQRGRGAQRVEPGYMRSMGIYLRSLTRQDVLQIAMMAFFLSFKIGILAFVFTRNAPPSRKLFIAAIAGFYVLWECQNMIIRNGLAHLRETARQLRAQQPTWFAQRPTRTAATPGTSGSAASGGTTAPTPRSVPVPIAPLRNRPRSIASVEFWMERLSYYGLEDEDREMGFRTMTSGGQLLPARHHEAREPARYSAAWTWRRLHDFVILPAILFIVTLVPDLEQRRRRAISKREQLIRSTARKVEALEARLREEQARAGNTTPAEATDTAVSRPLFLRTPYGRRLLADEQSGGPQLDIGQELDAAAALAAGERPQGGDDGAGAEDELPPPQDEVPHNEVHDDGEGLQGMVGDMNFL